MYRRQHVNIPIEIVRTVVAISETGSLSKAGERLGLSQPAISSQVKRLQNLVGGALFVKTANGTTTTELGKLALQQARIILEANDQLLRLGGSNVGPQPLRLGLSTLFVDEFIKRQTPETLLDVFVHTDDSTSIGRGLIEGYIDVACIYRNQRLDSDIDQMVVNECDEPLVWVRAKNFALSPGSPLPILTYPGDDWMIPTLTKLGLSYKIVFNSLDYHARISAVEAGVGLTSDSCQQDAADAYSGRGKLSSRVAAGESDTLCATGVRHAEGFRTHAWALGAVFQARPWLI